MLDFEKLGLFYLGRVLDPNTQEPTGELLLEDARDLTTHAVIVGMTGSGKTGLAIDLLEEAAIDGIPAFAIDPKGDLGNLALAFPELRAQDFRPWVDEGEARRAGMDPDAFAAKVAKTWSDGVASWGQDGARIARFREAAELAIYTPGSSAGQGLSILRSLAPPAAGAADPEALGERVQGAVSALLGLVGHEADPLRSREHVLLSQLVLRAWSEGRALDLGQLVREIHDPGLDRVGVLDLESFYPARERADLALAINNLLASPRFAAWLEGEPLDVAQLLRTDAGRPRLCVVSIAHLSDAERMFFVTLLLHEIIAWMRTQPGTSSLRALVYMDEVFGYLPPTASPPSKLPMLVLLKQARAFGVGVVLATQNPVDLDYKALSNAGTWYLGRLQTERDKLRVLEGLAGASSAAGRVLDRAGADAILSALRKRAFLRSSAHDDAPLLFESRWALSYLRGPLTREQIRRLSAGAGAAADRGGLTLAQAPRGVPPAPDGLRPVVAADVPERFLRVVRPAPDAARLVYRPSVGAVARLHHVDARAGIDVWRAVALVAPFAADGSTADWAGALHAPDERLELEEGPQPNAGWDELPPAAARAKSWPAWERSFRSWLYRESRLVLSRCRELGLVSRPGVASAEFRGLVDLARRERRDAAVDRLRAKHAVAIGRLAERERRALARVEREAAQVRSSTLQSAISIGATLLGVFVGRKKLSVGNLGRATTAARGLGRRAKEREDVGDAEEALEAVRSARDELEAKLRSELEALPMGEVLVEPLELAPRKADTLVESFVLAWAPWWIEPKGAAAPAWR
jgi:DNA helicase HerA-like ATPase